ncbi:hypothetical protein MSG28_000179 [Choristoneura fumiferana]|uniref:Uncharacterized protein n=1 Tax=Choristoneura fumiferana TaxID=7141 RepID=A0ACC0JZM7_CHOFU|nr:hypothetical protein MSG28_000179 [Choristoneura fumiferana]
MADEEEMKGAGLMMGKRCLWDPETDQYVHALFKNDSIYCHTTHEEASRPSLRHLVPQMSRVPEGKAAPDVGQRLFVESHVV